MSNDYYDNNRTDREMLERLAPPVLDLTEAALPWWGGFQAAANWVSEIRNIPVSRQRVYSLHKWRAGSGFPAGRAVRLPSGRIKPCWFRKEDVTGWAMTHKFRKEAS